MCRRLSRRADGTVRRVARFPPATSRAPAGSFPGNRGPSGRHSTRCSPFAEIGRSSNVSVVIIRFAATYETKALSSSGSGIGRTARDTSNGSPTSGNPSKDRIRHIDMPATVASAASSVSAKRRNRVRPRLGTVACSDVAIDSVGVSMAVIQSMPAGIGSSDLIPAGSFLR